MRNLIGMSLAAALLTGCIYPPGQIPDWLTPPGRTVPLQMANFQAPATAKVGQDLPIHITALQGSSGCIKNMAPIASETEPGSQFIRVGVTGQVIEQTTCPGGGTGRLTATFTPKAAGSYRITGWVTLLTGQDYSHLAPVVDVETATSKIVELTQTIIVTE